MRIQRFLAVVAVFSAAGLTQACHAHGDQAVSTIDHQVTVEFFRHVMQDDAVELKITNGSAQAVCLSPASLDPSNFSVKTDQGVTPSITPAAHPATGCDPLAPAAVKSRSFGPELGFSRAELQTGRLCYHYAFGGGTPGPTAWQTSGMICE